MFADDTTDKGLYTVKSSGVKEYDVCNIPSKWWKKNIHIIKTKMIKSGKMLTSDESR